MPRPCACCYIKVLLNELWATVNVKCWQQVLYMEHMGMTIPVPINQYTSFLVFCYKRLNNWYSQDTRATSKKFHGKIAQLRPHCKAPCSAWWLKVGGSQGSRGRSIEDFGPQTPSFLYVTGATPRKSLPFFFVVAFVVRDLSKFP